MRKGGTVGLILGLAFGLVGCSQAPSQTAAPGADLFGAAARVLGLAAPVPPPAPPAPKTASAKPKPKPQCLTWGKDVYGDPTCIAYSHN